MRILGIIATLLLLSACNATTDNTIRTVVVDCNATPNAESCQIPNGGNNERPGGGPDINTIVPPNIIPVRELPWRILFLQPTNQIPIHAAIKGLVPVKNYNIG